MPPASNSRTVSTSGTSPRSDDQRDQIMMRFLLIHHDLGVLPEARPLSSSTVRLSLTPARTSQAGNGKEFRAKRSISLHDARTGLPHHRPDAPRKVRGSPAAVSWTGGRDLQLVLGLPARRDDGAIDLHKRPVWSPTFRWARQFRNAARRRTVVEAVLERLRQQSDLLRRAHVRAEPDRNRARRIAEPARPEA